MKKRVLTFATIIAVLIFFGISTVASNPIISYKIDISDNYAKAIKNQASGIYSEHLPLIPIYVSVDSVSEESVFYTIYYFPFGTMGMSYTEHDVYNIEKPLTGA